MSFKKTFILFGVLFFTAEPFLVHSNLFLKAEGPKICSQCGMKDVCGAVCCCVKVHRCDVAGPVAKISFRTSDCAPERPALAQTFSDMAKWLPRPALISPEAVRVSWTDPQMSRLPHPEVLLLTPPPESAILFI